MGLDESGGSLRLGTGCFNWVSYEDDEILANPQQFLALARDTSGAEHRAQLVLVYAGLFGRADAEGRTPRRRYDSLQVRGYATPVLTPWCSLYIVEHAHLANICSVRDALTCVPLVF